MGGGRRVSDFNASPGAFARTVRVMLLGYVSVSAGRPWRSLGASQKRISTVEGISRISARTGHSNRHKIAESEMNLRCEWARIDQADTILRLSDVIEVVGETVRYMANFH